MRIWKCDTKWGKDSVLKIFTDFRIAFFGQNVNRIGHFLEVVPGDLLGISNGTEIIAISEITSPFTSLGDLGKSFLPRAIIRDYVNSGVEPVGCRLSNIVWLDHPIINDRRGGRFYELPAHTEAYAAVKQVWERSRIPNSHETFNIEASRMTLVSSKFQTGLFCGSKNRYVVPVYQRPYAWEEREITRLLEDIADGVRTGEPHFLGAVQISAPRKLSPSTISFDLIDGQQRISTLLILLKCLGHDYTETFRTVVNAGSAQKDWDDFNDTFGDDAAKSFPLNQYIAAATIIQDWIAGWPEELPGISKDEVADYVQQKLLFVVIQTFAGISKTIQLFNVINTAGMDLNASDLFKIRFYEYLTKDTGPDESLFVKISECYQKVEEYNREHRDRVVSMQDVMSFYQKVIVSRFKLNSELFRMGSARFFERMFDCLLEGKKWPGFSDKGISITMKEFENAVDVLIKLDSLTKENQRLRIMRRFLWETRYGGVVYQYPALACYFGKVKLDSPQDILSFTELLFKKLVPPSLEFGRVVDGVYSLLHKLLHTLSDASNAFMGMLSGTWNVKGMTDEQMLEGGLNQDLACKAPWKNLACKLVEFLLSGHLQDSEVENRLFLGYDIEHIQSNKDIENPEKTWKDWGWEINGLGNLSMLEYKLNRSIRNFTVKKEEAYRKSHYVTISQVLPLLDHGKFSLENAQKRRVKLGKMIKDYILSP